MFFRQIDGEFVKHFTCVARQTTKQCTVAIHHNETKLTVICQQCGQRLHTQITNHT